MFGGKQYDEIFMTWGGLHLDENFGVDFGEGCMSKYAEELGFWYQLNVCCSTDETDGRAW
jgi:hypothetical protein